MFISPVWCLNLQPFVFTFTDHDLGINFPAYAFENQAETEGFAKMAKRAGYSVVGLPNYVVWHIDTEEKPGNLKR